MKLFGFEKFLLEGEPDGGAFMGGGGGTPPEGGGTPPPDDGGVKYHYPEGLDESYHGNPTLLKYADKEGNFNQAEVMKALIHASSTIGADKMTVPTKNFTDEQWRETFTKLGLPADVKDYNIDVEAPEGMKLDTEILDGVKNKAHELGVLPKQLKGIVDFYNNAQAEQMKAGMESYKQEIAQNRENLRKEWGDSFNAKMQMCEETLNHFFPEESDRKAIAETGFLDTIVGTKFFNMLGEKLQEDGFNPEIKGSFGNSMDELDTKITETHGKLMEMGKMHPQYNNKLKEYQTLLNKRHGTQIVGAGSAAR